MKQVWLLLLLGLLGCVGLAEEAAVGKGTAPERGPGVAPGGAGVLGVWGGSVVVSCRVPNFFLRAVSPHAPRPPPACAA